MHNKRNALQPINETAKALTKRHSTTAFIQEEKYDKLITKTSSAPSGSCSWSPPLCTTNNRIEKGEDNGKKDIRKTITEKENQFTKKEEKNVTNFLEATLEYGLSTHLQSWTNLHYLIIFSNLQNCEIIFNLERTFNIHQLSPNLQTIRKNLQP